MYLCSMWYPLIHSVRSHFSKLPYYVNSQIYPKQSTPHLKEDRGFATLALFTCFSMVKGMFYYRMPGPQSGFPSCLSSPFLQLISLGQDRNQIHTCAGLSESPALPPPTHLPPIPLPCHFLPTADLNNAPHDG